jgi:hypothetical protein
MLKPKATTMIGKVTDTAIANPTKAQPKVTTVVKRVVTIRILAPSTPTQVTPAFIRTFLAMTATPVPTIHAVPLSVALIPTIF